MYNLETIYTANKTYSMPNIKIIKAMEGYVYVPLRGYCASLGVFTKSPVATDKADHCIGWIDTMDLGCHSVKEWIEKTNWVDEGY